MHELFVTFLNLKKIAGLRKTQFRHSTYVRLKKKTVDLEPNDPEVDRPWAKKAWRSSGAGWWSASITSWTTSNGSRPLINSMRSTATANTAAGWQTRS